MKTANAAAPSISAMQVEIRRLLPTVPFRPFALRLKNGGRIVIEHFENIAFDPADNGSPGSSDFYVISGGLRLHSTLEAVTSVVLVDEGR